MYENLSYKKVWPNWLLLSCECIDFNLFIRGHVVRLLRSYKNEKKGQISHTLDLWVGGHKGHSSLFKVRGEKHNESLWTSCTQLHTKSNLSEKSEFVIIITWRVEQLTPSFSSCSFQSKVGINNERQSPPTAETFKVFQPSSQLNIIVGNSDDSSWASAFKPFFSFHHQIPSRGRPLWRQSRFSHVPLDLSSS